MPNTSQTNVMYPNGTESEKFVDIVLDSIWQLTLRILLFRFWVIPKKTHIYL